MSRRSRRLQSQRVEEEIQFNPERQLRNGNRADRERRRAATNNTAGQRAPQTQGAAPSPGENGQQVQDIEQAATNSDNAGAAGLEDQQTTDTGAEANAEGSSEGQHATTSPATKDKRDNAIEDKHDDDGPGDGQNPETATGSGGDAGGGDASGAADTGDGDAGSGNEVPANRAPAAPGTQANQERTAETACERFRASLATFQQQAAQPGPPHLHPDSLVQHGQDLPDVAIRQAIASVTEAISARGHVLFSQPAARRGHTVF